MRSANISRKTAETEISVALTLEGKGIAAINTGCGFLDHMLTLFALQSRFDITAKCAGDTSVDYHHTVEDVAIVLGGAIKSALGEMRGIARYGESTVPMDEALVQVVIDICSRSFLACSLSIPSQKVGDFDTELVQEFMSALCRSAGITLHIRQLAGANSHHIIEAAFKALGRAMRQAAAIDPDFAEGVNSTKGTLI